MTTTRKLIITTAALVLTICSANAAVAKPLNPQTMKNLEAAMHGEAFANLKYRAFADQARESGNEDVAKLFEESANVEANEHFAREASALGLAKSNKENLSDAMKGEHYENTKMYKEFAEQATKAGDVEAAKLFEQIRQDEGDHYEAYKAAFEKLSKQASK